MVHPQPLQRIGQEILHRLGSGIVAGPASSGIAQGAELDADEGLVALAALQGLADQHLVMAHAVEIAGVEQGDAALQRGVDGGDALAAVDGAIHARHAHAAQPQGGSARTGRAELTILHDRYPFVR